MIKKILFLGIGFVLSSTSIAQNLKLDFGFKIGSSGVYEAQPSVFYADERSGLNIIGGGLYDGCDFDPGPATAYLPGAITSAFIAVYKPDGAFQKVVSFENHHAQELYGVYIEDLVTDTLGNIYVTGKFDGDIDFHPHLDSTLTLTAVASSDTYVLKLDPDLNLLWIKTFGSSAIDVGSSIKIDKNQDLYIGGSYGDSIDFDLGPGVSYLEGPQGSSFLLKMDNNANFLWVKDFQSDDEINVEDLSIDEEDNLYLLANYMGNVTSENLSALQSENYTSAVIKLNTDGDILWGKGLSSAQGQAPSTHMVVDKNHNIHLLGTFTETVDFDPGDNVHNLTAIANPNIYISKQRFVLKLDSSFNFLWVRQLQGVLGNQMMDVDNLGAVYIGLDFEQTIDADPSENLQIISSAGDRDSYILKLDLNGTFQWVRQYKNVQRNSVSIIDVDEQFNLSVLGYFQGAFDLDLNDGISLINSTNQYPDLFFTRYKQKGINIHLFHDLDENCERNNAENMVKNYSLIINPGGLVVQSDNFGTCFIDSLSPGSYTVSPDSANQFWQALCPLIHFTITNPDTLIQKELGLKSTLLCTDPQTSIYMPTIRPCFGNQKVYVQSCNNAAGTEILSNVYTEVALDDQINFQSASIPHTVLGNNIFRFNHADMLPGQCVNFYLNVQVACDVFPNQTLCVESFLYPADSCVFDTVPGTMPFDFTPCGLPWDRSSLSVEGWCQNDSIYFVITNRGEPGGGDMDCYAPVRLYIDAQYTWFDSIQLSGGETKTYVFPGDGRTWRLEADQHPLHPGNSHPNASLERCGDDLNWTPDQINLLPQDDAEPVKDIFCGIATASFDPNDKTGYPLGIGTTNLIQPNQQIDYVVRFQNTGNDTAFTVVIRDTLDTDLNIFSVRSGAASHNYSFRMYGPRVLEWTFNNILLPDSTTNEAESHGFITFSVNQNPDLADSTEINNQADIYFDFNPPIITNTTLHKIGRGTNLDQSWENKTVSFESCDENIVYNGKTYTHSGTYYEIIEGITDTLLTVNIAISQSTSSSISVQSCQSFTAPDMQVYTQSGTYTAVIPNTQGCDSTITIDLTIKTPTSAAITESVCGSYTAPDMQVYTQSGTYTAVIPNTQGCDSTITIDLTIKTPTNSAITESVCETYTAPDMQVYTQSGTYTAVIPNTQGCDSTITIDLTIKTPTSAVLTESVCETYTAPDNQIYTQSGTYTAVIPNAQGCDSMITVNLMVNHLESTVINESPVLRSPVSDALYQWIDCLNNNEAIPGETGQTFTVQANGEYAVIVTADNCSDTSACILVSNVGLDDNSLKKISVYPNPVSNQLTISLGEIKQDVFIRVYSLSGQLIEEQRMISKQELEIDTRNYAHGMYFLEVTIGRDQDIFKFIKE